MSQLAIQNLLLRKKLVEANNSIVQKNEQIVVTDFVCHLRILGLIMHVCALRPKNRTFHILVLHT